MSIVVRVLIVAAVLLAAWLVIRLVETRRPRRSPALRPGLTIATGPDCRICELAVTTISRLAGALPVDVVPADRVAGAVIRSIPTVLVADAHGRVILRRSGKSALADARLIVDTATAASGREP